MVHQSAENWFQFFDVKIGVVVPVTMEKVEASSSSVCRLSGFGGGRRPGAVLEPPALHFEKRDHGPGVCGRQPHSHSMQLLC